MLLKAPWNIISSRLFAFPSGKVLLGLTKWSSRKLPRVSKRGSRAKGAFKLHPVIKNALPNSFGVTKGYWSGLGPFKIGWFQQHDLTANIYPEMTTICGSMAPHVEGIPMEFCHLSLGQGLSSTSRSDLLHPSRV